MAINGVSSLNQDVTISLKNRGKKSSGITFELKNIFEELEKAGQLKDVDGKGLTSKDARNLYSELNKIHQETHRATNYTRMQVGQKFTYTAAEMQAMAKAAGYKIQQHEAEEPGRITPELYYDEGPSTEEDDAPLEEEIQEETVTPGMVRENTKADVIAHGGKIKQNTIDGLKRQDVAIYQLPESKVNVQRAFNASGELGDALVSTNRLGKKRYISLRYDDISSNLGEMKLKKVKVNGNSAKEFIVAGKSTDEIGETKYYRFIPKTGHPDSDGKNNRLGEEVFKINGKYVTIKPEVSEEAEKPQKKQNFITKLFKGKKSKQKAAEESELQQAQNLTYDYNADYSLTRQSIANTMKSNVSTSEAMTQIFGISEKKANKMLKKINKYGQKHDINTPEGQKEVYKIADKYGVTPGKIQAFLDFIQKYE